MLYYNTLYPISLNSIYIRSIKKHYNIPTGKRQELKMSILII